MDALCDVVSPWALLWGAVGLLIVGAFVGVLVSSALSAIGQADALEEGFRRGVDAATRPADLDDRRPR